MENRIDRRKLAFFLPNIFTALNMACGFASVILSWRGDFEMACLALFLGAIFDSVDGRVARLTGTQSSFGEQFDSLSDVVSFGVGPAFMVFFRFFSGLGRVGLVISFLFLLCGALRLARFNANIDKVSSDYFQGLPIPGAAMALVGYVLLSLEFPALAEMSTLAAVYVTFYALLMISTIPFQSFKNSEWIKNHKKLALALLFFGLGAIFAYERYVIGIIIGAYVLASLIYFFAHKGELKDVFLYKNDQDGV